MELLDEQTMACHEFSGMLGVFGGSERLCIGDLRVIVEEVRNVSCQARSGSCSVDEMSELYAFR